MPGLIYPWGWVHKLPQTLPLLLEDIPALEAFLQDARSTTPELVAMAVLRDDGGLIAQHDMPDSMAEIYRMCAAQVAIGQMLIETTGRGTNTDIYLRLPEGYIWLVPVPQAFVLLLLRNNSKL